eukprot:TRINITY_DN11499_c0_g1_i1.p1 TRINITY_DN11499_c0_g1~~TRINITY_DN11499_c0_g1_i1.p1  ORF type:complete len:937 (+),score=218.01 TRINITY_DN11499_c0_g1_i1:400-3210(+)
MAIEEIGSCLYYSRLNQIIVILTNWKILIYDFDSLVNEKRTYYLNKISNSKTVETYVEDAETHEVHTFLNKKSLFIAVGTNGLVKIFNESFDQLHTLNFSAEIKHSCLFYDGFTEITSLLLHIEAIEGRIHKSFLFSFPIINNGLYVDLFTTVNNEKVRKRKIASNNETDSDRQWYHSDLLIKPDSKGFSRIELVSTIKRSEEAGDLIKIISRLSPSSASPTLSIYSTISDFQRPLCELKNLRTNILFVFWSPLFSVFGNSYMNQLLIQVFSNRQVIKEREKDVKYYMEEIVIKDEKFSSIQTFRGNETMFILTTNKRQYKFQRNNLNSFFQELLLNQSLLNRNFMVDIRNEKLESYLDIMFTQLDIDIILTCEKYIKSILKGKSNYENEFNKKNRTLELKFVIFLKLFIGNFGNQETLGISKSFARYFSEYPELFKQYLYEVCKNLKNTNTSKFEEYFFYLIIFELILAKKFDDVSIDRIYLSFEEKFDRETFFFNKKIQLTNLTPFFNLCDAISNYKILNSSKILNASAFDFSKTDLQMITNKMFYNLVTAQHSEPLNSNSTIIDPSFTSSSSPFIFPSSVSQKKNMFSFSVDLLVPIQWKIAQIDDFSFDVDISFLITLQNYIQNLSDKQLFSLKCKYDLKNEYMTEKLTKYSKYSTFSKLFESFEEYFIILEILFYFDVLTELYHRKLVQTSCFNESVEYIMNNPECSYFGVFLILRGTCLMKTIPQTYIKLLENIAVPALCVDFNIFPKTMVIKGFLRLFLRTKEKWKLLQNFLKFLENNRHLISAFEEVLLDNLDIFGQFIVKNYSIFNNMHFSQTLILKSFKHHLHEKKKIDMKSKCYSLIGNTASYFQDISRCFTLVSTKLKSNLENFVFSCGHVIPAKDLGNLVVELAEEIDIEERANRFKALYLNQTDISAGCPNCCIIELKKRLG